MAKTEAKVEELFDMIERGKLRLPEIHNIRTSHEKAPQVAPNSGKEVNFAYFIPQTIDLTLTADELMGWGESRLRRFAPPTGNFRETERRWSPVAFPTTLAYLTSRS